MSLMRVCLSAVHEAPAGRFWVIVVLAEARRVVGGGENIAGGVRGWEMVAGLLIHAQIILVYCL